MADPVRLDVALVQRECARSRTHAQELITAGRVRVDGVPVRKSSARIPEHAVLEVTGGHDYVGRAGAKLAAAVQAWPGLRLSGQVCLDMGASTGGFTQVLLEAGASQVYAVDVGHGQLAAEVRADARVINVEGLNIKELDLETLPRPEDARRIQVVVGDLSFISLTQVIPVVAERTRARDVVVLVKPQFEVGRAHLGPGGVVTDPRMWKYAIDQVSDSGRAHGLAPCRVMPSPQAGRYGNREFLLWMSRTMRPDRGEWDEEIHGALERARRLAEGAAP